MLNHSVNKTLFANSKKGLAFLTLCCLLPIVSFFGKNSLEITIDYTRGLVYILGLMTVSLSVLALMKLLFKRLHVQAMAITLGLLWLFSFHAFLIDSGLRGLLTSHYQFRIFLLTMFIGVIGLSVFGYLFFKKERSSLLGFLMISMVGYIGLDITQIISSSNHPKAPLVALKTDAIQKGPRTNVYFIVPDMMLGPEMHQKLMGEELTFIPYLKSKDFVMNEKAFSNAPVTVFSLSHVLNMDYPLAAGQTVTQEDYLKISQIFNYQNEVYKRFHEMGYPIHYLSDGYVSFCSGYEDHCIQRKSLLKPQDMAFLDRTQLITFLDNLRFYTSAFDAQLLHYPNALEIDDIIPKLSIEADAGYFMFLHIGLPHFPFRYKADCSRYNGDSLYYAGDKLSVYAQQQTCAQTKFAQLIDHITEQDPHAIILVQSDHGTITHDQGQKPNAQLTENELLENFNILSAYRLPQQCQNMLPSDGLSPVNSFRLIFGCLNGEKPEYLPHQSFIAYYLNWEGGQEPIKTFDPKTLLENA